MGVLPEIVTVRILADFLNMNKSTIYCKISKLKKDLPPTIEGIPTLIWHGRDIEKVLYLFKSCSASGQRVREKFGK